VGQAEALEDARALATELQDLRDGSEASEPAVSGEPSETTTTTTAGA
jgi:hypothetical protein